MERLPLGVKPQEFVASLRSSASARYHSSDLRVKLRCDAASGGPADWRRGPMHRVRTVGADSRTRWKGRSGCAEVAGIRDVITPIV